MNLLDQIRYENESTGFDFKATSYAKDKAEDLLKDLLAMANADLASDRYIVTGVKHQPNGERTILGIEEYVDDAGYYQLVHSNIEPDIQFEFFYQAIDEKTVGVFRIFDCHNPPYLIKRDGKTLRRGDSFIRKGTTQLKVMRSDLDRMYAQRQAPNLTAKLAVAVEVNGELNTRLAPALDAGLPSARAARKIRRLIAEKEMTEAERVAAQQARSSLPAVSNPLLEALGKQSLAQLTSLSTLATGFGGNVPYEKRDVDTLKRNLEAVEETYREQDLYYCYEERAQKINFLLSNDNDRYVEDCSLEILIDNTLPLVVAPKVFAKPANNSSLAIVAHGPSFETMHYPRVAETPAGYLIKGHIGDLRHNLTTAAFKVPVRVTIPANASGQQLTMTVTLFGKNLPRPYSQKLSLLIG